MCRAARPLKGVPPLSVRKPNALFRGSALMGRSLIFFHAMGRASKVLICSVGYGQGHHAAAAALAEEWESRGAAVRICDPCALARPRLFAVTRAFYGFCVRRAPWLWGVTYAQTDTANWRKAVDMPLLRAVKTKLAELLREEQPDVVVCTYPLYAFMLDALRAEGRFHGRYALVVTDALEISRPWMQSSAPLVVVPDACSAAKVRAQFGLSEMLVQPLGFPVRREFRPGALSGVPTSQNLRVVFGAYRSTRDVARSVRALLTAFPAAHLTLLSGARACRFSRLLHPECVAGQVEVLTTTERMASLFAESHLYIGKAGAATMFECYASRLPMLVNFALPGQEQGNAELLQHDGAGRFAETPAEIVLNVQHLLQDGAAEWQRMRAGMDSASYDGAAARIVDETERRFFS